MGGWGNGVCGKAIMVDGVKTRNKEDLAERGVES